MKGLKNPLRLHIAKVRPTRPNKGMRPRRPRARRPEKIKRKKNIWNNKTDEVDQETVVPLQLELMLFQPQSQVVVTKRRRKPEMPYLAFPRGVRPRKRPSKLKIVKAG